jgi:hypothetical protein
MVALDFVKLLAQYGLANHIYACKYIIKTQLYIFAGWMEVAVQRLLCPEKVGTSQLKTGV